LGKSIGFWLMMISVVSPVYLAEDCLRPLVSQPREVLAGLEGVDDYEIVLIEDCGKDDSWSVIRELAQQDSCVRGLQLSKNFGQHHAITAGLDIARGDWVVVLDRDLQDRPADIELLYARAQQGYDVVNARRQKRQDRLWKRLSSHVFHLFLNGFQAFIRPQSIQFSYYESKSGGCSFADARRKSQSRSADTLARISCGVFGCAA
jgi:glycosyltransferase involved in cell wall biosynthesis